MKTFKTFREMLAYLRGKDQESKLKEVKTEKESKLKESKPKKASKKAKK